MIFYITNNLKKQFFEFKQKIFKIRQQIVIKLEMNSFVQVFRLLVLLSPLRFFNIL